MREGLSLVDGLVDVGVEFGDDAGGFGFDLNLRDGLDFAGGDDGAGDVAGFGGAELGGVERGRCAELREGEGSASDEQAEDGAEGDPELLAGLAAGGQRAAPSGKWLRRVIRGQGRVGSVPPALAWQALCQAYLRSMPRTLPWMETLTAGA